MDHFHQIMIMGVKTFTYLSVFYTLLTLTSAETFQQPSPWWAKPLTEELSTAGCLTKSQIQQAKDVGYKSIISMFNSATEEQIGDQKFPSTSEEEKTVRELGMEYKVILDQDEYDWMTLGTLRRFSDVYPSLPKPVLFHCMSAYSATFISLLYMVNRTRHQEDVAVTMDAAGMLAQTAAMGFDYSMDEAPLQMLREISGEEDLELDIKPEIANPYWNFGFWYLKPVTKNWYHIGQLRSSQYQSIKDNEIDMIVHVHSDINQADISEHKPDILKTSGSEKAEVRDAPASRPDPRRMECPDVEIGSNGKNGQGNHQSTQKNMEAASKLGMTYRSIAIKKLDATSWLRFKSHLLDSAAQHSGVLVYGEPADNAVILALLAAGCQHDYNSTWARDLARRHGYDFPSQTERRASATSDLAGKFAGLISQLRQWSPLLADLATPVGQLVGLHPVATPKDEFGPERLLEEILDHRDTMC